MAGLKEYRYYAGGDWHEPSGGAYFESDDPTHGAPWARIPLCTAADVDVAVRAAQRCATEGAWAAANATERGRILQRMRAAIAANADANFMRALQTPPWRHLESSSQPGRIGFSGSLD